VKMVIVAMVEAIVCGDRFEITGFGSSTVREYEGYVGRNPKTGVITAVPPENLPFFKVGKELKEGVNPGPPSG
jgi:integration host factor subunit beta